jgi:hypothetical protein
MFLRIRWFMIGAVASAGAVAYLANQVRKARERITPRNVANSGLKGVARLFDHAAAAVQPGREGRR